MKKLSVLTILLAVLLTLWNCTTNQEEIIEEEKAQEEVLLGRSKIQEPIAIDTIDTIKSEIPCGSKFNIHIIYNEGIIDINGIMYYRNLYLQGWNLVSTNLNNIPTPNQIIEEWEYERTYPNPNYPKCLSCSPCLPFNITLPNAKDVLEGSLDQEPDLDYY